ncbi:MAG: hemerythrin domain-containing protein [Chloroflexi bacterium]|nr:hemerythrin domain-containing protein [Chloroflexota bacterium]
MATTKAATVTASDAIDLLVQDHDKVENMFTRIEQGVSKETAQELFTTIYHELTLHAIVEEQIFYPAVAQKPSFKDLLKDAFSEHAEVKQQLGDISYLEPASAEWTKMMGKVWKELQHHINDEEEKLFPKVREEFTEKELKALAGELEEGKHSKLDSELLSMPLGFAKEAKEKKTSTHTRAKAS